MSSTDKIGKATPPVDPIIFLYNHPGSMSFVKRRPGIFAVDINISNTSGWKRVEANRVFAFAFCMASKAASYSSLVVAALIACTKRTTDCAGVSL